MSWFDNQNNIIILILIAIILYFMMKKDENFGCMANQKYCGSSCVPNSCNCKNGKCTK